MIIYDLKCTQGHKFEGWFQDRKAFEEQQGQKLISCPVCGSMDAEIVPSSLTVVGKEMKAEKMGQRELPPQKTLQLLHEYIDKNFEDVGARFAEVAIRIHYGEEEARNIKGMTTQQEEETLREEGIKFIKVPVPKFDS